MAVILDNLKVLLTVDLDDYLRDLKKAEGASDKAAKGATKGAGAIQGAFAKLAAAGVVMMAAGAMKKFASDSIQAASDVQENYGKFQIVFGEFTDSAMEGLTKFGDSVGRSRHELMGYAATIQDTLVPMGMARGAAAEMSVEMVKLATDLSSFNNMPMDEAIRRLQGTLIGSHENAVAFGVIINENTLSAELNRLGTEGLTATQLEALKVQARLNLIYAGTTDAQGDALRTADSYANRQKALEASTLDLQVAFGQMILPVAEFATEVGIEATKRLTGMAGAAEGLQNKMDTVNQEVISGNITWEEYEERIDNAYGSLGFLASGFGKLTEEEMRHEKAIIAAAGATDSWVVTAEAAHEAATGAGAALDGWNSIKGDAITITDVLDSALQDENETVGFLELSLTGLGLTTQEQVHWNTILKLKTGELTEEQAEQLNRQMILEQAVRDGNLSIEDYISILGDGTISTTEFAGVVGDATVDFDLWALAADTVYDGMVALSEEALPSTIDALSDTKFEAKILADQFVGTSGKAGFLIDDLDALNGKETFASHTTTFLNIFKSRGRGPVIGDEVLGGGVSFEAAGTGPEGKLVPPGHPNDSFFVGMTSGERYFVYTEAQQRAPGHGGDPGAAGAVSGAGRVTIYGDIYVNADSADDLIAQLEELR